MDTAETPKVHDPKETQSPLPPSSREKLVNWLLGLAAFLGFFALLVLLSFVLGVLGAIPIIQIILVHHLFRGSLCILISFVCVYFCWRKCTKDRKGWVVAGTAIVTLTAFATTVAGVAIILNLLMSESTIDLLSRVIEGLLLGTFVITSNKPKDWDFFWEVISTWRS